MLGAFVLLALTAGNPAPDAPAHTITVDTPQGAYAVVIEYQDGDDLLRRATVTLRPIEAGARAPWPGHLTGLFISPAVPADSRAPIHIRTAQRIELTTQRDGSYQGSGLVPRPRSLERLVLQNSEGEIFSFRIPPVSTQDGDEDPPKDPPEDPPEEDPPTDDPPEDDEGCTIPAGCEIVNPWTCKCESGLEDPWGVSAQQTGANQVTITL